MATNNQQQYSGLEYGLLIPRPTVKFRDLSDVPGVRVEPVNSEKDTSVKPVVITTGETYDFEGVKSGGRSGLLRFAEAGPSYKIKGCRIERTLGNGLYQREYGTSRVPANGHLLALVEQEIKNTIDNNEILTKERFLVPYEPEAMIHYGVMFPTDIRPKWFIKLEQLFYFGRHQNEIPDTSNLSLKEIAEMLYQRGLKQDELAASVMKVKGDTRIPALYGLEIQDYEAASTIAYRLGLIAGAQLRVTEHEFIWEGSAHVGNYVLWVENNQLHISMVDFEDTPKYNKLKNQLSRFDWEGSLLRRFSTNIEFHRRYISSTL